MRQIWIIAKHTFLEAARDRILYGLAAFALVFILLDLFLARLAIGDPVMIKSFGLAGIYIFGLIITIFLGSSLIYREIERRTAYLVLTKPVSPGRFIWGKFLGLSAAVSLTILLMAAVYMAVIFLTLGYFDFTGLAAIILQLFEMMILVSVLVFLSSLVRPMTATICAILIAFTGHLLPSLVQNTSGLDPASKSLGSILYYVLPNLDKFDVRGLAAHGLAAPENAFLLSILYALAYSTALIILAIEIFRHREL